MRDSPGETCAAPNENCFAAWDRAGTGFLDSIGVPIVRGRGLGQQDTATSPQVVVVNQAFVKHFFPNQDPIGKHFGLGSLPYSGAFEIAGVFADFKMTDPRAEPGPLFFRPLAQQFNGYKEEESDAVEKASMYVSFLILDFTQTPFDTEALARRTFAAIDPALPVIYFHSYDFDVAANFNQDRLIARLTSFSGFLRSCSPRWDFTAIHDKVSESMRPEPKVLIVPKLRLASW